MMESAEQRPHFTHTVIHLLVSNSPNIDWHSRPGSSRWAGGESGTNVLPARQTNNIRRGKQSHGRNDVPGKGGKRMARRPRNRSAVHISTGSYVCEKA